MEKHVPTVVVDTNIIVSAHLNSTGFEARVLDLVLRKQLLLMVSDAILDEYESVLRRPKFALPAHLVSRSLAEIRVQSHSVRPNFTLSESLDEDDNRFLECAEAAAADFLVTGNLRHFPRIWKGTKVVTARELIEATFPA